MELPKRKMIRLQNYDYSQSGVYFITICTHNKEKVFSEITNGTVRLLPTGELCQKQIQDLSRRYPIEVDKYVIMPNHIHLLIRLRDMGPNIRDVICTLKSMTSRLSHAAKEGKSLWQRSYYDHVIRTQRDYDVIWMYIDTNPQRWAEDRFYTI